MGAEGRRPKPKKEEGLSHTFDKAEISFAHPSDFFKGVLERPVVMWRLWKKEKREIFEMVREEIKRRRKQGESKNTRGHHINGSGLFQSDKYPDLKPDKIILSFHDPEAQFALLVFSLTTLDGELGEDILRRLLAINTERRNKGVREKAD